MNIDIEKIIVAITKEEAFDIINCLTKALDPFTGKEEYPKATEFSQQLRTIFMSQVNGIHCNFK